jgi:hypothetical protein
MNASPFSKLTLASMTPGAFFRACSTELAHPPQVIPVTRMVVVLTAAETLRTPRVRTSASTANKLIGLRIFLSLSYAVNEYFFYFSFTGLLLLFKAKSNW